MDKYKYYMIQHPNILCDVIDICNFSCLHCNHMAPYFASNMYSFEEFNHDIRVLAKSFHCHTFTFSGGEPLMLGNKLFRYFDVLRSSGICDETYLITNGQFIGSQDPKLLQQFDRIQISIYPKNRKKVVEWVDNNKHKYNLIPLYKDGFGEGFTTQKLDQQRSQRSWTTCFDRRHCNVLYKGHFYYCASAAKCHTLLNKLGIENIPHHGCAIHQPLLEKHLKNYIVNQHKISTCSYCLGYIDGNPWQEKKQQKLVR